MMLLFREVVTDPLPWLSALAVLSLLGYVVYQRFLHPLAKYPGPFLASLTDVWQAHQFMTLQQPYYLTKLHEKHGPIVRYGPDKLSVTDEACIPIIYQKSGKSMPKTEFYDAYGAAHPNVFGMRNENIHSIRRRHMSYSFSSSYVKEMEPYLDINIKLLNEKIIRYCLTGEVFDLKKLLHYYVIDVLGELAFSNSFGIQETDDESRIPPVVDHSLLAAVTGAWPLMTKTLKTYLPFVPHAGLQQLFKGRQACADLASRSVQRRIDNVQLQQELDPDAAERKDLLTNLILAKHPDTGERLTQMDLETEAFGFIIAGTHTTSATTTLLFYHLLHNPGLMDKCVSEVDANLPPLERGQEAYPLTVAEASLPYLKNCIKENFRVTPVFTMPLARRVMSPEGVVIAGQHIPQGTSVAVCNHAFHHNPDVWGSDHNVFDPSRWERPEVNAKSRLLMHFGLGGRQCIGKTVATTNIYKVVSILLRKFRFELPNDQEAMEVERGLYVGKIPEMVSVGISDLKRPLLVKAKTRNKQE
ncbi:putative benzoate 4-monooxygenase cytochrome P450 [Exophiala viscosa]|uniref:Benzoate 4-monooxygenase cytochrome P450 n=1 Tax=Exophiala viscosa TaxID=2486360 RepID=A0AAN6IEP5_9EURO|nr:putative benzoate 4-monooxygenase cytochrome P450 [Exophiala viscosa]KAI1621227.1 putative benzoate 4-monooxygenase cytochrome P450 [Exophiala viscosa]